jgi:hypothetical protein
VETIEATLANPRSVGLALKFSDRIIGYAVGSSLENYDEEGVHDDPSFGENQTYYLLAIAVLPSIDNATEIENHLLDTLRQHVIASGYVRFATLMEERSYQCGPHWLRSAEVLRVVDNYLRSGERFVYLHTELSADNALTTVPTDLSEAR